MHPAMMPNVLNAKGVHYFSSAYHRGDSWYLSHFPSAADRSRHASQAGQNPVVGEASPYYMFHPKCAERILRTAPDVKLLVLLRDPVKRAISHHQHMVFEGHEKVLDVDEALDLEHSRLNGTEQQLRADPTYVSRAHQHFSYISRGHYASQLETIFSYFDRKNVLVMATETLTSASEASLEAIQKFIGLNPDPVVALGRKNASVSFSPRPETLERLRREFATSNERLKDMLDVEIPWV